MAYKLPLTAKEVEKRLLKVETLASNLAVLESVYNENSRLARIDVGYTLQDGAEIKFKAPVNSAQIIGIIVYYPDENNNIVSKEFSFVDANKASVANLNNLFTAGAIVKAVLDIDGSLAFIQNADTNIYIESSFVKTIDGVSPDNNGNATIYKDVTADFEGTDFNSAWEYLLSLATAGKYCCKDQRSICYSDIVVDPTNSSIFNTITCYYNDGSKYIHFCLNNQEVSYVEIYASGEIYAPAFSTGIIDYVNEAIANVTPTDITEQLLPILDEASSFGGESLVVFYWIGLRLLDMLPTAPGKYTGLGGVFQADITCEEETLQSSELYMTFYNTKVYITYDINSGLSSASGYVRSYGNTEGRELVENYSGGLDGDGQLMPYKLGGLYSPTEDTDAANKKYVDDTAAALAPTNITEEVLALLDSVPEYVTSISINARIFWLALQLVKNHTPGEYTALNGSLFAKIYDDQEYLNTKSIEMQFFNYGVEIRFSSNQASGYIRSIISEEELVEVVENFTYTNETIQRVPYRLGGLSAPTEDSHAANKKYVDTAVQSKSQVQIITWEDGD